jgi:formylmethanofuran dehydrogenase subunit E
MQTLDELLADAHQQHGHSCAGYVLGMRVALTGCRLLGIEDPRRERNLVVYIEIDRCAADAVQTATGCSLGKRTLKHLDYGKLAATFLHTGTGQAVRVGVRGDARARAEAWEGAGRSRSEAQKLAYRELPDDELLTIDWVQLRLRPEDAPGRPIARALCNRCGEEINDRREVPGPEGPLCQPCAFGAYYEPVAALTLAR